MAAKDKIYAYTWEEYQEIEEFCKNNSVYTHGFNHCLEDYILDSEWSEEDFDEYLEEYKHYDGTGIPVVHLTNDIKEAIIEQHPYCLVTQKLLDR